MTRWIYKLVLIGLGLHWLTLFVLTHLPPRNLPTVHLDDKIEHFLAYSVLAILLDVTLAHKWRQTGDWATILIVLAYGAVDEWTQPWMGRSCELLDWLADGAGAAVGVCLCGMVRTAWKVLMARSVSTVFSSDPELVAGPSKVVADAR